MPPKRRKFSRPLGERRYRKIFILAVEGIKTEPLYFAVFNDQNSVIRVNCLKGKHDSSPPQVLARMESHLKKEGLKKSDEAWLSDTMITDAIRRARQRDNPPCGDWRRTTGTTVYKLVESILDSHRNQ